MSFNDDFEDALKMQFQIAIVDYTMENAFYNCKLHFTYFNVNNLYMIVLYILN